MNKLIDIIAKYQKYLIAFAVFLILSAVSITFSGGDLTLTLKDYPFLMMLMAVVGISLLLLYIAIDKSRINKLSQDILDLSAQEDHSNDELLKTLTSRQTEVYNLIIEGKSNKEIMSIMFIEQSTLKSHINQIYKKLKVSSRKELKSS